MCLAGSLTKDPEKYLLFKGNLIGRGWTHGDEKRMMCRYFGKMPLSGHHGGRLIPNFSI
jgi:hypothetical protein